MNQKHKRQTILTIETHSLTIIRTCRGTPDLIYCRNCRIQTPTFVQLQAALILRVSLPEIERLVQTNHIHFAGDSALCGNSLASISNRRSDMLNIKEIILTVRNYKAVMLFLCLLCILAVFPQMSGAQTTEFTYQGQIDRRRNGSKLKL